MHKLAHYPKIFSVCQDLFFLLPNLKHTNYRKGGVLNLKNCLMHYSKYNPNINVIIYSENFPVNKHCVQKCETGAWRLKFPRVEARLRAWNVKAKWNVTYPMVTL